MTEVKRFASEPYACYVCPGVINKEVYYEVDGHKIHKACLSKYLESKVK